MSDGGILLSQVKYAEALKPIVLTSSAAVIAHSSDGASVNAQSEDTMPLTPAGVTLLRGGIGAVLLLCLTRWDLLFDLIALQTQVTHASVQAIKDCNAIITRAKRHTPLGLRFPKLPGSERRIGSVADSSHASRKSSYAFEGNLVLLQPEMWAEAQSLADHQKTLIASRVPGLSGKVHPLHVKSQQAKRLSHNTSHAESLSQMICSVVAECVAMRCDASAISLQWPTL